MVCRVIIARMEFFRAERQMVADKRKRAGRVFEAVSDAVCTGARGRAVSQGMV